MTILKITLALITLIIFNGCADRYHVIHVPFVPGEQCVFERLTESEKQLMSEDTKFKLGRNYKGCIIRKAAEDKRILEHNELHKE